MDLQHNFNLHQENMRNREVDSSLIKSRGSLAAGLPQPGCRLCCWLRSAVAAGAPLVPRLVVIRNCSSPQFLPKPFSPRLSLPGWLLQLSSPGLFPSDLVHKSRPFPELPSPTTLLPSFRCSKAPFTPSRPICSRGPHASSALAARTPPLPSRPARLREKKLSFSAPCQAALASRSTGRNIPWNIPRENPKSPLASSGGRQLKNAKWLLKDSLHLWFFYFVLFSKTLLIVSRTHGISIVDEGPQFNDFIYLFLFLF